MPNQTALIGRDRAYARVLDVVEREDGGVVSITGLAGVGKTRLARAVLDAAMDGVFVPVVSVTGGAQTVGDAITASLAGDRRLTRAPSQLLWESFEGRPAVVVLDDADHSSNLDDAVAALIAGYPAARLVLTAARPTRAPGEQVIALRPLPVPRDGAGQDHPCVRLFVERAAQIGVEFDLADAQTREGVIRVCQQTGGLPLAIELAAARTATQPLRFVERTLWRGGPAGRRRADRPLYRSLGWALSMLSPGAALALPQAALFASPFQLDAAAAVIELPGEGSDVYDALEELVDAYLLEFDTGSRDETRLAMREPIRAFALDQLGTGELEAVQRRHGRYFRDRARAGTEVVARDWPDIAQALDYAIRHGVVDDALILGVAAAPAVQRLAGAGGQLRARLDELVEHSRHARVRSDPVLRARAMVWSTALFPADAEDLANVGMWTAQQLAEATALARESGDESALMEALEMTVRSLPVTLDISGAASAVLEGLEGARRSGDQRALARFETWAAMEAQMRGNAAQTVRFASSALTRGREHDEPIAVIWAARMLLLAPDAIRPAIDPPVPDLRTVLAMCERSGQPLAGMTVLGDLSRLEATRGDIPGAARWAWHQLMIAADRVHSDPLATALAVANTVSLALLAGHIDQAIRLRGRIRSVEPLFSTFMPPQIAADYAQDCARLERLVPAEHYARLAEPASGTTMGEANRMAQAWVQRLVVPEPAGAVGPPAVTDPLTTRQREVLCWLATGSTNQNIADALSISTKTVMHHSVAIYRKLGVRGRAAAAAWAVRAGLIDDHPLPGAGS